VQACRPDVFLTTVSYPIKGTPYYDECAPKLVQLGLGTRTTGPGRADPRPPFAPFLSDGGPTICAAARRPKRNWRGQELAAAFDEVEA
jgi:hypothetical protein